MQTVKWLTLFYTLTFPIRGEAVQNLGMTRIPPSEFVAVEPSKVFKIQFNTDHRLFKDYNLFFSYTMRGFWDRTGLVKSKPFIDINHNPELYYLISPDQIISLDADGFTVGDGTPWVNVVNINTNVYSYAAYR